MALVRGRGPGVSTDMVALAAELLRRPCEDHDQDRVDPHITWAARLKTLAADYDRDVAEAEARGWNAALEAAVNAVDDVYPVSDQWGHHTLPHIDQRHAVDPHDRAGMVAQQEAWMEQFYMLQDRRVPCDETHDARVWNAALDEVDRKAQEAVSKGQIVDLSALRKPEVK